MPGFESMRGSVFMIALKMYGDAFHPNGSALHW